MIFKLSRKKSRNHLLLTFLLNWRLSPRPIPPAIRQLCPNDCSGAGTCHHSNGTCACLPHRVGDDCSSPFCAAVFSARCKECTFEECTVCDSGYYVKKVGSDYDCLPCDSYDPRCTRCDVTAPLREKAHSP